MARRSRGRTSSCCPPGTVRCARTFPCIRWAAACWGTTRRTGSPAPTSPPSARSSAIPASTWRMARSSRRRWERIRPPRSRPCRSGSPRGSPGSLPTGSFESSLQKGGRLSSHNIGISFREVMSGGFVLGATDPADGETRGRAEGSEMTLHGAIDIDDIDRFIAEADHPGTLTGTLDFTPFGDGMAAGPGGIFNLFSPTSDPKLKLMVYEMGFQHGGKSYYLAGQKDVRQDPIFDLWKATTTLFSKLHEGTAN